MWPSIPSLLTDSPPQLQSLCLPQKVHPHLRFQFQQSPSRYPRNWPPFQTLSIHITTMLRSFQIQIPWLLLSTFLHLLSLGLATNPYGVVTRLWPSSPSPPQLLQTSHAWIDLFLNSLPLPSYLQSFFYLAAIFFLLKQRLHTIAQQ